MPSLIEMIHMMCNPDDPDTWLILGMANDGEILLSDYDGENAVVSTSLEGAIQKKFSERTSQNL